MTETVPPDDHSSPSTVLRIVRKGRGFVQIDNAAVRDVRLSFRARGVLAYLLSHRSGYRCTSRDMAAQGQEGRTAILTAMKELVTTGYVSHEKVQTDGGRWVTITTVREDPSLSPGSDCRTSVPGSGEPDLGLPDPLRSTSTEDQLSREPDDPEDESEGIERDDEVSAGEVLRAAFEIVVAQRMVGARPSNLFAYRNTVRANVRQDLAALGKQYMADDPTLTPEALAAVLEPPAAPPPPPPTSRDPLTAAQDRYLAERAAADKRKAEERRREDEERQANLPPPEAVKDQLEQARKRLARKQAGVDDETAERVGG